jgi:hypothetical protein
MASSRSQTKKLKSPARANAETYFFEASWARGTYCIGGVFVTGMDAKSYRWVYCKRPPDKALESGEKLKKKKYLEASTNDV